MYINFVCTVHVFVCACLLFFCVVVIRHLLKRQKSESKAISEESHLKEEGKAFSTQQGKEQEEADRCS